VCKGGATAKNWCGHTLLQGELVDTKGLATALHGARATLRAAATDRDQQRVIAPILVAIAAAEADLAGHFTGRPDAAQGDDVMRRVAELENTVRAHEEFLSTLGHELRNPLSPLCMQAEYLRDAAHNSESGSVAVDWLVPQLDRFGWRLRKFIDLLNRIMDVSRLSAGQVTLELEPVDLAYVSRDVCTAWDRELSAAKCELSLHADAAVMGTWDRMRIEQIVSNLLSNAIRYGAGKPIHVSVRATASHAHFSVRDQGIGIAEQDRDRIFQRFERVSSQRHAGGFGIGLWIVLQSCVAMGGSIDVRSQLGVGSEFIVTLPLAPNTASGSEWTDVHSEGEQN
jgi:signal transduction histidine kinase